MKHILIYSPTSQFYVYLLPDDRVNMSSGLVSTHFIQITQNKVYLMSWTSFVSCFFELVSS